MKHGFELHGFFLDPKSAYLEALLYIELGVQLSCIGGILTNGLTLIIPHGYDKRKSSTLSLFFRYIAYINYWVLNSVPFQLNSPFTMYIFKVIRYT